MGMKRLIKERLEGFKGILSGGREFQTLNSIFLLSPKGPILRKEVFLPP